MKILFFVVTMSLMNLSAQESGKFKLQFSGLDEKTVMTPEGLKTVQVLKKFKIDARVFDSYEECYLDFLRVGVNLMISRKNFKVIDVVPSDYQGKLPEGVFLFLGKGSRFSCEYAN